MKLTTVKETKEAVERIKNVVVRTPLVSLHSFDKKQEIFLKPENLQPVGSFKLRGVFNAVASLTEEQRQKGLSTFSSGNTAQALGWAARYYGISARTVMRDSVPKNKIDAIKSYGVESILLPLEDMRNFVLGHGWVEEPYSFIHPWFDPKVRAGHGTIGMEILLDMPDVDTVYIPVGGGGLICGVGAVLKELKPSIRVVGVQPKVSPTLSEAFKAGKGIMSIFGDTIADTTAPIVDEMFPLLKQMVDDVVLVSEKAIKKAMKHLMLGNNLVVEGAGAMSVAAALKEPFEDRGMAVCILSGGSIDADKLAAILNDPSLV